MNDINILHDDHAKLLKRYGEWESVDAWFSFLQQRSFRYCRRCCICGWHVYAILNMNWMKCIVLMALSGSVGVLFLQKWKKVMTNRRIELLTFRFGIWRATNCASRPYISRKKQQYILYVHLLSRKQHEVVSTFSSLYNNSNFWTVGG